MNMQPKFRLNPERNERDRVIVEALEGADNVGGRIKAMLYAYITGVTLTFNGDSQRNAVIAEFLNVQDTPQEWLEEVVLDLLYERITGTHAKTGAPLENVQIVEVPTIIEKTVVERVEVLPENIPWDKLTALVQQGSAPTAAAADDKQTGFIADDLHSAAKDVDW